MRRFVAFEADPVGGQNPGLLLAAVRQLTDTAAARGGHCDTPPSRLWVLHELWVVPKSS